MSDSYSVTETITRTGIDIETARGFGWGIVATIAMSALMLAATATGLSPLPEPVPKALAATLLGGVGPPLLIVAAVGLHFTIGGVGGASAAYLERSRRAGLGVALGLWVLMQLAVFPLVGWGVFGIAVSPKLAVATLVLHLVYGLALGTALQRDARLAGAAA